MRYKDETLTRFTERALVAIARARAMHDPKVCISVGNKKVGRVLNVSTMPLICCGNCSACRNYCYDVKAALFRDTVMNARARNTALAQDDLDEYVAQIKAKLTARRKRKAFRLNLLVMVGFKVLHVPNFKKLKVPGCRVAEGNTLSALYFFAGHKRKSCVHAVFFLRPFAGFHIITDEKHSSGGVQVYSFHHNHLSRILTVPVPVMVYVPVFACINLLDG